MFLYNTIPLKWTENLSNCWCLQRWGYKYPTSKKLSIVGWISSFGSYVFENLTKRMIDPSLI